MKPLLKKILFRTATIVCLAVLAHQEEVCAQGAPSSLDPSFERIQPPSPNASALAKFGNIPVGPSTGIPSVSIPIYSWKSGSFEKALNISLDYHAGGIRVDDMASNVGIGWVLNSGGVVTRTVRGIADETDVYGFLNNQLPANVQEGNGTQQQPYNTRPFFRMYMQQEDSQNDLFTFNFNGRSGQFVLGKNNQLLQMQQSRLKIVPEIANINGYKHIVKFEILDEDGYRYVFSEIERTTTSIAGVPPPHNSAWYLTKVVSPARATEVLFSYEDSYYNSLVVATSQALAIPIVNPGNLRSANMGGTSSQNVDGKRIKFISFPDNTTVEFVYASTNRSDIPTYSQDKLLEKIAITNGSDTFGFLLNQDYSLGGRATLRSVKKFGEGMSELKPYLFEYFDAPLPARFSSAKDHWGFANSNGDQSLIPEEYVNVGGGNMGGYHKFLGGTRDTDPWRVLAGSLTKITYPSGGSTVFTMEANTATDQWLNKDIRITVPNPYTEESTHVPVSSATYPGGTSSFVYGGANNSFTEIEVLVNPYQASCSGCQVTVELYTGNNVYITGRTVNFPSPNSNRHSITWSQGGFVNGATYIIKTYANGLSNYYDYVEFRRKETNPPGTTKEYDFSHKQLYVGGIRAKRVEDFIPTQTAPVNSVEYEYTMESGESSGSLGYRPVYSFITRYGTTLTDDLTSITSDDYLIRSSSSVNDIPTVAGSPVTYKRVVEKIGKNGVYLGKTVKNFTSFKDIPPRMSEEFPKTPTQYSSWAYGLPTEEAVYNDSNQLLRKTRNIYNFVSVSSENAQISDNFRSISISPTVFKGYSESGIVILDPKGSPRYFAMSTFLPIAGRKELQKTFYVTFNSVGDSVVSQEEFEYDPTYFYLRESLRTSTVGTPIRRRFTYAPDIAANDVAFHMTERNMLTSILSEQEFVGGVEAMVTTVKYAKWFDFYAPSEVWVKHGEMANQLKGQYLNYDKWSNLLSFKRAGGLTVNNIWGFGGGRLIATVSNIDYSVLSTNLGGDQNIESFTSIKVPTAVQMESYLNSLNNSNFSQTEISKFGYSPFGMIKVQTDAKGQTIYYEYDEFQRLKTVKDQDGNVLKSYNYHYKN